MAPARSRKVIDQLPGPVGLVLGVACVVYAVLGWPGLPAGVSPWMLLRWAAGFVLLGTLLGVGLLIWWDLWRKGPGF